MTKLPDDIAEHLLKMGPIEWGATPEQADDLHLSDFADTLSITREEHDLSGNQRLHGAYLKGTETVLCHTGTSPNSPMNARILAAAWNQMVEIAKAQAGEAA